jgi:hypothetical protein
MQTSMMRSEFMGTTLKKEASTKTHAAGKVQTQALFKKAAKAAPVKKATAVIKKTAKAAPAPVKKAAKAASGKRTKGWFGGEGGPGDLGRWYGEFHILLQFLI